MPLPLIAIGIGVGAASAAGGVAAAWKMRKDKKRYEERRKPYESRHGAYVEFVETVNQDLDDLHKQRVDAVETLRQAADFLVRANVKDRDWQHPDITPEQFAEIENVVSSLAGIAARLGFSYAGSGAAGVGAAAGAYAAASAFGTASTGAAISGLAGAAARNATLAWLGGGSLASGGGGMAAGVASLAGIALAPLAIIPPIVMWTKAIKQSHRIDEAIKEMDENEAEIGEHMVGLTALRYRVREMSKAVGEVEQALKDILRLASPDKIEDVYRVASAAKALAELLDTKD